MLSDSRVGDWFTTYSGKRVYPLDLREEDIDINDIAHSLSNICRFQGHCKVFYSVAQHSVHVSQEVQPQNDKQLLRTALLHDATEAYLGDVIRPLKGYLGNYVEYEERAYDIIASRFDLLPTIPSEVKTADNRMLVTERRDLVAPNSHPWMIEGFFQPFPWFVDGEDRGLWSPAKACYEFIQAYYRIG